MESDQVQALIEKWAAGVRSRDLGEWIIVHEHHSQPLDFDTARIGPESH